jgi:hypothetical protein
VSGKILLTAVDGAKYLFAGVLKRFSATCIKLLGTKVSSQADTQKADTGQETHAAR